MPWIALLFCLCLSLLNAAPEKTVVRVGHFATITHAQGLAGHYYTRQQKGWFEKRLGPDVEVQWYTYNAGPSAMEAIFADSIDLTYVGPSPTINAYIRSKGKEIRIVCGSCSGGAALIVQPDGIIETNADFKGKKVGTPQLGNTQDIAARSWLRSLGLEVTLTDGDVQVIPTPDAEQLVLFKNKDLDAVWTIEPWVSQLILQANGKLYLEESELWPQGRYVTTHLVSSTKFLDNHSDLVKKWIAAHIELTEWMNRHPEESIQVVANELKEEMKREFPLDILKRAWGHIQLTYDPIRLSLFQYAEKAYQVGLVRKKPNLAHIYDLALLKDVLEEKKLPEVQ